MAQKKFQPLKAFSQPSNFGQRFSTQPNAIGSRLFTGQTGGIGARFAGGPTRHQQFRVATSGEILRRAKKSGRGAKRTIKGGIRFAKKTQRFVKKTQEFVAKRRATTTRPKPITTTTTQLQQIRTPKQLQRQLSQPTPAFIQKKIAETKVQFPKSPQTSVKIPKTKNGQAMKNKTKKFASAFDRAAAGRF